MKSKNVVMMLLTLVLSVGAVVHGEAEQERGYIGIRTDARPLPELLIKHLRLDEHQGIRIQNVGVGTPADKAGLDRDDIIIGLNGEDVTDSVDFAKAVQESGAGAEIALAVIHLGELQGQIPAGAAGGGIVAAGPDVQAGARFPGVDTGRAGRGILDCIRTGRPLRHTRQLYQ